MERNGQYVRENHKIELTSINEVLRGFRFARRDFDRPATVCRFLMAAALLCKGSRRVPCSTFALEGLGQHPCDWLKGTERSETVLRELCRDPVFVFDADTWTVTFNAFRKDGGVDHWRLTGRHDREAFANEILQIDVSDLLPAGTFSWPFSG